MFDPDAYLAGQPSVATIPPQQQPTTPPVAQPAADPFDPDAYLQSAPAASTPAPLPGNGGNGADGFDPDAYLAGSSASARTLPIDKARLTFYTRFDDGPQYFDGRTAASGPDGRQRAREGITIAVDPAKIPYGSKVFIPALKDFSANKDGIFLAHDTGADVRKRTASAGKMPVLDIFVDGQDAPSAQARRDAIASAVGSGGLDYQVVDAAADATGPVSFKEFAIQRAEKKDRSFSDAMGAGLAAAGSAIASMGGTIAGGAKEAVSSPTRIPASLVEGATRGTYDLLEMLRRTGNFAADTVAGSSDPRMAELEDYQRYLADQEYQRSRAQGRDGSGNLAPQLMGAPLPQLAEASSMVLDPTMVIPAVGAASKFAGAGTRMAAHAAIPVARAAEVTGRAVGDGIINVGKATGEGIARVTGATPEMIRAGAGAVGAGSLLTPAAHITATAAGTVAAAKATEKTAQAVGAVAEKLTNAPSQWGALEQLAKDQSQPGWLRQGARTAANSKIATMTGKTVLTATEGAVQGGIIGGTLAALSGGNAEEIGAGIGGGVAMGSAGAVIGRAASRTERAQARQAADVARFLADQASKGADTSRLAAMPRGPLTRIATLQQLIQGDTDVQFLSGADYLKAENAGERSTAGVYLSPGANGRARILVNMDAQLPAGRTLEHEFTHALVNHPSIDKTASRFAVDRLYGPQLEAMAREYAARLIAEPGRKLTTDEITAKVVQLTNESIARGDLDGKDWIRDEIFAEQMVKEMNGGSLDLNALRKGMVQGADLSPLREGLLKIKASLLARMGVALDDSGKPLQPTHEIFQDNPLMQNKGMRELLSKYLRERDQWLEGLSKTPETKGAPIVATPGKLQELAASPAVEWRLNKPGGFYENDFAVRLKDGTVILKEPKVIAAAEQARLAQAQALHGGKVVPRNSTEFGKRIDAAGKSYIGGPTLPANWDWMEHFSPETRATARAMEASNGETFGLWYHQIGSAGPDVSWAKAVKTGLGNVAVTQREVSHLGWKLSKAGNLLAEVLDVGAARKRMFDWYRTNKLERWGGNLDAFQADLQTYLANHAAGLPGENGLGTDKRNVLNAFFGINTNANKAANPIYGDYAERSLIKSFRLDRINNAQPSGRTGWKFDYNKVNQNFSPDLPQ